MTRYFFHVRDGESLTRDEEGVDLPDLDAVRWEAEQGARGFKKMLEARNAMDGQQFEVADAAGNIVFVYPFSQA